MPSRLVPLALVPKEANLLEIFKVRSEEEERVDVSGLRQTVTEVFRKMGVPPEDCELGADVLLAADLRGVETHGVSNMLRSYVRGYTSGSINPRPNWRILRESPSTANIDSDGGLGIIVTPKAMEIAIEKASASGMGVVTIRNSGHLGMASYHAMMALEHDMIGVCMTACPPLVVPTFGAEPRLGTNPIALAAPAGRGAAVRVRRGHVHGSREQNQAGAAGGRQADARLGDEPGRLTGHGSYRPSGDGLYEGF